MSDAKYTKKQERYEQEIMKAAVAIRKAVENYEAAKIAARKSPTAAQLKDERCNVVATIARELTLHERGDMEKVYEFIQLQDSACDCPACERRRAQKAVQP